MRHRQGPHGRQGGDDLPRLVFLHQEDRQGKGSGRCAQEIKPGPAKGRDMRWIIQRGAVLPVFFCGQFRLTEIVRHRFDLQYCLEPRYLPGKFCCVCGERGVCGGDEYGSKSDPGF